MDGVRHFEGPVRLETNAGDSLSFQTQGEFKPFVSQLSDREEIRREPEMPIGSLDAFRFRSFCQANFSLSYGLVV